MTVVICKVSLLTNSDDGDDDAGAPIPLNFQEPLQGRNKGLISMTGGDGLTCEDIFAWSFKDRLSVPNTSVYLWNT